MTQFTEFDREMKKFEKQFDIVLPPRTPVIIRLDGRSFSKYTKAFEKPYDENIRNAMIHASLAVMNMVPGAKVGFLQSDEASILVKYYEFDQSMPFFGNRIQKLCSVIASCFTAKFNEFIGDRTSNLAEFDCRVFTIPAANVLDYFIWRQVDCIRNSILTLAQQTFSQKELHGKKCKDLADVTDWSKAVHDKFKFGTTIYEFTNVDNQKQFLRGYLKFSQCREFFKQYHLDPSEVVNYAV